MSKRKPKKQEEVVFRLFDFTIHSVIDRDEFIKQLEELKEEKTSKE